MQCRAIHGTLDYLLPDWKTKRETDLANASGIPKSDGVRTSEAHDQSWTIPGRIMGNQKFGSKSRLVGSDPLAAESLPRSPTDNAVQLSTSRSQGDVS